MYRLLMADDEEDIRSGLKDYFTWEQVGFEVVGTLGDGKSVLRYVSQSPVDVLLCDINMPDVSGIEVAQHLSVSRPGIKIVFLTGYRSFEYARKAIDCRVRGYLLKPTRFDELFLLFTSLRKELDAANLFRDDEADEELSSDDPIINRFKKYIRTNYQMATLEDLAGIINMSYEYLSRYIKQKTGNTFSEHLTDVRLRRAQELLSDPHLNIASVSRMVGYASPQHFDRVFKKHYGVVPKQMRG